MDFQLKHFNWEPLMQRIWLQDGLSCSVKFFSGQLERVEKLLIFRKGKRNEDGSAMVWAFFFFDQPYLSVDPNFLQLG